MNPLSSKALFLLLVGYLGNANDGFQGSSRLTVENQIATNDSLNHAVRLELRRTMRSRTFNNPKSVRIDPGGKYAYVNNLEGLNTAVIDVQTGQIRKTIHHTGKPVEIAFTGGGRYVWISYFRLLEEGYPRELGDEREYRFPSVVVVYDTVEQKLIARVPVGIIPKVLAVSPDVLPEQRLVNVLAQVRARRLLAHAGKYF